MCWATSCFPRAWEASDKLTSGPSFFFCRRSWVCFTAMQPQLQVWGAPPGFGGTWRYPAGHQALSSRTPMPAGRNRGSGRERWTTPDSKDRFLLQLLRKPVISTSEFAKATAVLTKYHGHCSGCSAATLPRNHVCMLQPFHKENIHHIIKILISKGMKETRAKS